MDIRADAEREALVVVPQRSLADLIALALDAADRLPESDPLARELRGSAAAARASAVMEP